MVVVEVEDKVVVVRALMVCVVVNVEVGAVWVTLGAETVTVSAVLWGEFVSGDLFNTQRQLAYRRCFCNNFHCRERACHRFCCDLQ